MKAFIREGWVNRDTGKKSDPRLQFNSVQLLQDVLDNYAKKLSIQLNIKELSEEKINKLQQLIQLHPGNQALNFVVYDNRDQVKLTMPSRKQKVKVSQELLDELENEQVYFKLN